MLRVLLFFIALLGNLSANSARQLTGAWAEMKPLYGLHNGKVVGIDAEISRLVFTSAGFKLNFDINDSPNWYDSVESVRLGKRDFIGAITKTAQRAKWGHFSIPYRLERNVIITKKDFALKHQINIKKITDFIKSSRANNFKIGTSRGIAYASSRIDSFVANPGTAEIKVFQDVTECLAKLSAGEVDMIIAERDVANFELRNNPKLDERIFREFFMSDANAYQHFIFNKEKFSAEQIEKINNSIEKNRKAIFEIILNLTKSKFNFEEHNVRNSN